MSQLINRTDTNPIPQRHIRLQRRYRDQSIAISDGSCSALPNAATFVPAAGYGLAFDAPVMPVGSVQMCIYGRETANDDRAAGPSMFYRGTRARYRRDTCEILWDNSGGFDFRISAMDYATGSDERLMQCPKFLDVLVGLHGAALRAVERRQDSDGQLRMPPTLLGFRPSEAVLIERLSTIQTSWVRGYAEAHGFTPEQAWRALYAETRVPDDVDLTGLRLVDARLCIDEQMNPALLPQIVEVYHDMRQLLGRWCFNPARKILDLQASNPASQIIRQINARRGRVSDPGQWTQDEADSALALMRERLGPRHVFFDEEALSEALVAPEQPVEVGEYDVAGILDTYGVDAVAGGLRRLVCSSIAAGCTNGDLIDALIHPYNALIASRIATRQVGFNLTKGPK